MYKSPYKRKAQRPKAEGEVSGKGRDHELRDTGSLQKLKKDKERDCPGASSGSQPAAPRFLWVRLAVCSDRCNHKRVSWCCMKQHHKSHHVGDLLQWPRETDKAHNGPGPTFAPCHSGPLH
jgi:hypothetical protein